MSCGAGRRVVASIAHLLSWHPNLRLEPLRFDLLLTCELVQCCVQLWLLGWGLVLGWELVLGWVLALVLVLKLGLGWVLELVLEMVLVSLLLELELVLTLVRQSLVQLLVCACLHSLN